MISTGAFFIFNPIAAFNECLKCPNIGIHLETMQIRVINRCQGRAFLADIV